jgi:uncharacterized membrane protein YfcA
MSVAHRRPGGSAWLPCRPMDNGQLLLVLVAVGIGFLVKGATGIGGPVFVIPVLAAATGVEYAVAVVAIPALVSNIWLVWESRSAMDQVRRYLAPMLAAGAVGMFLGVWVLVRIDDRVLSVALATLVFVYIAWYAANRTVRLSERTALALAAPVGFLGGGLQGATGISAPVIATYTHALALPRSGFVFAVTFPFAALGTVQVGALALFGAYDAGRLATSLLAIVPVAAVMPFGIALGRRMSQHVFQVVVLAVLAGAALRLLWSSLT